MTLKRRIDRLERACPSPGHLQSPNTEADFMNRTAMNIQDVWCRLINQGNFQRTGYDYRQKVRLCATLTRRTG
jgi:hypothetical protein